MSEPATTTSTSTSTSKPEEAKKPTAEEMLAEMKAMFQATQEENKKSINLMAEAIVKLNEKIDSVKASAAGGGGGATDWVAVLKEMAGAGKTTSLEELAKLAEGFARTADALERFRHPYRLGPGEAMLMRLGVRAAYPRYMTKTEIDRMERAMRIPEAFEVEEETEHVSE